MNYIVNTETIVCHNCKVCGKPADFTVSEIEEWYCGGVHFKKRRGVWLCHKHATEANFKYLDDDPSLIHTVSVTTW